MPSPRVSLLTATLLALVAGLYAATPAQAIFMRAPAVPADRLITNIQAYIDEHPDDPEGYFLLARVHYIAFAQKSPEVRSTSEGSASELPSVSDPRIQYPDQNTKPLDNTALIAHARAAIAAFQKAIEKNSENPLYHLGYAGILEQSAKHAEFIGKPDELTPIDEDDNDDEGNPPDVTAMYLELSLAENLAAYNLDRKNALESRGFLLPFYPVAYEAGQAYLRLIDEHDALKPESEELAQQIKDDIRTIDNQPKAITPIILRLTGQTPRSLNDLIDPAKTVNFDLDADGTAEPRPWVRPDTALLVWDPQHTGKITTGQQLFGNMTFFMLFSDGYRALDSLDNNRDGQLSGDELKGLALWTDANTNGVSDPREVVPIANTPVAAISTRFTSRENGHPTAVHGLTLTDGTTRPTWDWIIPAAQPQPE